MSGFWMLFGFVFFVIPDTIFHILFVRTCPACRGIKRENRGIDYPGEFIPCSLCNGRGWQWKWRKQ